MPWNQRLSCGDFWCSKCNLEGVGDFSDKELREVRIADRELAEEERKRTRPQVRKRVARHRALKIWRRFHADGWESVAELRDVLAEVKTSYVPTWELPDYLRPYREQAKREMRSDPDRLPSRKIMALLEKHLLTKK